MKKTKKAIITYISLLLLIVTVFSTLIIIDGRGLSENIIYALILMYSPAILAIIINLIFYKNLKGFGWRLGKFKYLGLSYLIPLLYILVPYTLLAVFGVIKFDFSIITGSIYLEFIKVFIVNIILLTLLVIGEEIGWRGFLLPHLCQVTTYKKASFIVGLVWVAVHLPIFIFSDYNEGVTPLYFRLFCFTILAFSINIVINWLRIKSGSLWTAVLLHTAHNSILQDINPLIVKSDLSEYIISESGLALMISGLIVASIYWSKQGDLEKSLIDLRSM
ncbi:MAG: type II CAAX endopeptidase family protein [Acidaminobacteraceae bacterium]